jgi:hypothetical protein
MQSGKMAYERKDHDEIEIRGVLFHPFENAFFSSGDDGLVKCYRNGVEDAVVDPAVVEEVTAKGE